MTTASTTRHVLFFPLLLLALFVSGCLELATASSLHDTSSTHQQQQRRADDSSPKRLIIAVGPRKAGTTDVAKFFYTHASSSDNNNNNNNNNKKKVGLNGWIWPTFQDQEDVDPNGLIPPEMHPYDIFRVYMNQPHNDPLIEVLDTGLKKAWDASTAGIIIASPFFDRVDDDIIFDNNNNNNDNSENPTSAGPLLARIIHDVLQIPNPEQQVTIVINYRTPRLDQWVSLFKHQKSRTATTTTTNGVAVDLKYVNFMCQEEYSDIRRHLVETSMNPLGIANFFIERYQYNVVLVDLEGAGAEDVAIGHAILCNVLEYCDTSLNADFEEDVSETHGAFSTLDDQKQLQLEQLFLERDCYYRSKLLKNTNNGNNGDYIDKFKALYPTNLWRGCLDGHISSYEKLTNPDTLVKALQSQKNCDHKLKKGYASGLLVGDIHTMMDNSSSNGDSSSSSSSSSSTGGGSGGGGGTTEDHEEPEAANGETNIEDTDDETDDDDNVDLSVLEQDDDDDKAEPDIEGGGDENNNQIDPDILEEEPLLVEKSTKEDAPFLTLMFFLVAIGAGAYQLKMMHPPPRQQQGGNNNNGLGPGALEFANTGSSSNGGSNYRDEGNYRDDDGEDEGDFI